MKTKPDSIDFDMRSAGPDGQFVMRCKIARLLQQGENGNQISKRLGVSTTHIYSVRDLYQEKGVEGLEIKRRGRKTGTKRKLTPEQEVEIQNTILNTTPEQHGFQECLWTRKNIAALILQKYNIELKLSTMGLYLQRWGYTAQRPKKQNRKQDPAEVQEWLDKTYPEICKRAKEEQAEIFFGDETNIRNTTAYMKGYAPKNNPPIAKVDCNKGPKINMVSAIANNGALRFMLYKDNMNAPKFIDFLRRLVYDRFKQPMTKKVFLIVDNYSVHTAGEVKAWVEKHKKDIELFYLPRYSPEYNPNEFINSSVKRVVGTKVWAKNDDELEHNVRVRLMDFRRDRELVLGCFKVSTTKYAASTPTSSAHESGEVISVGREIL